MLKFSNVPASSSVINPSSHPIFPWNHSQICISRGSRITNPQIAPLAMTTPMCSSASWKFVKPTTYFRLRERGKRQRERARLLRAKVEQIYAQFHASGKWFMRQAHCNCQKGYVRWFHMAAGQITSLRIPLRVRVGFNWKWRKKGSPLW